MFLKQYLQLYTKSLKFVFSSSILLCLFLLVMVPIQALLPSISLYITNKIIDSVTGVQKEKIIGYLVIWCIVFISNNVMPPINTFIQGQLTDKLTLHLNDKIMEKSGDIQDIGYFENSEFYDKINLISQEAAWRPVNLIVFGTSIITNGIMIVSMLGLLLSFHVIMALILLAAMIIQGIVSYRIQQQAFETLVSNSQDSRKLSYYSEVLLTAETIKEVRLYNLYDFFRKKYRTTYELIRKSVQKNRKKQIITSIIFLIFAGLFSAFSFAYVIGEITGGSLGVGTIVVFTSAILYSVQGITLMVQDGSLLYDTLLYMENLFSFLQIKDEMTAGEESFPKEFKKISFNQLSFSYPDSETMVLEHVSFEVNRGEKIAIVGENGAGKSTLVKLLLRMYGMKPNMIYIDNKPIEHIEINAYRGAFSAVFQDFAQFDLTLEENIILSELLKEGRKEELHKAMTKGGVDWIEEEEDKEKMLGKRFEGSKELSGGQWQRIALARAFYKEAEIVIFDEPTSALDARMEKLLFDKLRELTKGKTVFYITHRLATVKEADKVLVLKEGSVIGFDTHHNLMKNSPYYSELYSMQADMFL